MLFKKSQAVYYENLGKLRKVTVSEQGVNFNLNYSSIELKPEDVPQLLSDITQLYSLVKPLLDKKSEEVEKAKDSDETKVEDNSDEPIDLSAIPF